MSVPTRRGAGRRAARPTPPAPRRQRGSSERRASPSPARIRAIPRARPARIGARPSSPRASSLGPLGRPQHLAGITGVERQERRLGEHDRRGLGIVSRRALGRRGQDLARLGHRPAPRRDLAAQVLDRDRERQVVVAGLPLRRGTRSPGRPGRRATSRPRPGRAAGRRRAESVAARSYAAAATAYALRCVGAVARLLERRSGGRRRGRRWRARGARRGGRRRGPAALARAPGGLARRSAGAAAP